MRADLANSQQRGDTNFFGELCPYARHVLDTERGHGKIGDVNICSTHITLTFLLPDPRIAPLTRGLVRVTLESHSYNIMQLVWRLRSLPTTE